MAKPLLQKALTSLHDRKLYQSGTMLLDTIANFV